MSTSRVIQWGCIVLLFAGIGAGRANVEAQAAQPDPQTELKELRAANADLQARIELLEKQNFELKTQNKQLMILRSATRTRDLEVTPPLQRIPDDWKRGEFNGAPVYLIPLDVVGKPTTRPAQR